MQGAYSLPLFYVFVSFLSYFVALNIQSYKSKRWHDQCGDALADTGSLSLVAAVAAVVLQAPVGAPGTRTALAAIAAGAWVCDFLVRLSLEVQYLRHLEE